MAIFYSDEREPYRGPPVDYYSLPATRRYLDHYSNYLILDAVRQRPKSPGERRDAVRELTLCEKRLAYWRRHPNFDLAAATRETTRLKAAWRR